MKDYVAPDWWYEPPFDTEDQVNDLEDNMRERAELENYLSDLAYEEYQSTISGV